MAEPNPTTVIADCIEKSKASADPEVISNYIAEALGVLQIDSTEDDAFNMPEGGDCRDRDQCRDQRIHSIAKKPRRGEPGFRRTDDPDWGNPQGINRPLCQTPQAWFVSVQSRRKNTLPKARSEGLAEPRLNNSVSSRSANEEPAARMKNVGPRFGRHRAIA